MKLHKIATLSLVLSLLLSVALLSGCGNKQEDSFSIHPDADGWTVSSSNTENDASTTDGTSVPEGNIPAPSNAPVQAAHTVYTVTGIIEDAAMGEYYVKTDDGRTIAFRHDGADLSALEDSRPGNLVTVYYTGALVGENSDNVVVLRMETPSDAG